MSNSNFSLLSLFIFSAITIVSASSIIPSAITPSTSAMILSILSFVFFIWLCNSDLAASTLFKVIYSDALFILDIRLERASFNSEKELLIFSLSLSFIRVSLSKIAWITFNVSLCLDTKVL